MQGFEYKFLFPCNFYLFFLSPNPYQLWITTLIKGRLDNLQIETFDFRDAATAGLFHRELWENKTNIAGYNRRIIANDVKILAQIKSREIGAIISKGVESLTKYINPLINSNLLSVRFIDMNKRLNEQLGELFPL